MIKAVTAGAFLFALAVPALAAPAAPYWIVVDAATHQCSIVEQDQKPEPSSSTSVIGDGYPTQEAAQSAIQHAMACGGAGSAY